MHALKRVVLPIVLATVWISISEFARNEYLLKSYWTRYYADMGLVFPSEPVNGAVWGLWSLLLAVAIYILSRRFNLIETTFLSWFMAFVMMWVVIGNMGVLPDGLLYIAVPLSLLEVLVAAYIIGQLSGKTAKSD